MSEPSSVAAYDPGSDPLVAEVTRFVKSYMAKYDASHDFAHIQRVVGLARHLASRYNDHHPDGTGAGGEQQQQQRPLNLRLVELAALLHDVDDHKYATAADKASGTNAAESTLLSLGCPPDLAAAVREVCAAVSWSGEKADPDRVSRVLRRHPELAVVQDADRLDAIGAVGIGRLFTYGGARTSRSMAGTMEHLDEKLLLIRDRLKTDEGRRLGRERTERLLRFREWFFEESGFATADLAAAP